MSKQVTIYCKNTKKYHDFPIGTSLIEIYEYLNIKLKYDVVAARVNYKVEDLNFLVYKPKDIEFIDASIASGMRVYVRTLCLVLSYAVKQLYPDAVLRILHSISKGYYCRIDYLDKPLSAEDIENIKSEMKKCILRGDKIIAEEKQVKEVKKLFAQQNNKHEDLFLFETINVPYMRFFRLNDYIDYYNGVLLPSTDKLNIFDLLPYYDGFLLRIPSREDPVRLENFEVMPKLYEIFNEFVSWNKLMNLNTIGEFNIACKNKQSFDLIKISEALHEKKVAYIADMIDQRQNVKLVLISGPSSSGKTTLSKRLSVQLMVNGLKPVIISMDNYFVDRVNTPKDESGDYDFETLHALDLPFFNKQMKQLLNGEEVELPFYNFENGTRMFKGEKIRLQHDTVIILEGIHALNPELLTEIPKEKIFKIYVSALTTISIDNHNWVPTTDTRLLRRIIRDHRYRNYSARDTIARWPSVRRGEEKWIFPYQEDADVMFNSALIFELAVLKKHAEPILAEVPKYCDEYTETHRLLKFLNFFVPILDSEIPPTSLLREFLGGSSFRY
ncbi:MAG: AAA family ATPase [Bacteroidales bacterium 36-12]|nr:MAG: AAA family ATPase [Bacteroidales bacterium 36-12]